MTIATETPELSIRLTMTAVTDNAVHNLPMELCLPATGLLTGTERLLAAGFLSRAMRLPAAELLMGAQGTLLPDSLTGAQRTLPPDSLTGARGLLAAGPLMRAAGALSREETAGRDRGVHSRSMTTAFTSSVKAISVTQTMCVAINR